MPRASSSEQSGHMKRNLLGRPLSRVGTPPGGDTCTVSTCVPPMAGRTAGRGVRQGLGARGRARATLTRRLCTIAGFYKNTVERELREHSPAAHLRRPRADYESHAAALDRNELSALPVAARLGPPTWHALISLLALNGPRISDATGAGIEHLDLDRGHRTVTITRTGGTVVTIPLAPRTARAIDLATGERTGAPVFLADDGAAAGPARHLHRRRPRRNAAR
jgi:integrase/recombinase XerD